MDKFINEINEIWLYSKYYGDMVATSLRLHDQEEDYAALLVLFNALELICKSVREDFTKNFNYDLEQLNLQNRITDKEYDYLCGSDSSVRKIRNIMTHRNAYEYCLEDTVGIAYPFSEASTWNIFYENNAGKIIKILCKIITKIS